MPVVVGYVAINAIGKIIEAQRGGGFEQHLTPQDQEKLNRIIEEISGEFREEDLNRYIEKMEDETITPELQIPTSPADTT